MNTWSILVKELKFHGIELIDSKRCSVRFDGKTPKTQGIFKTVRQLNSVINHKRKLLFKIWNELCSLLEPSSKTQEPADEIMIKLFIFSLKDLINYLLCFEECEQSKFQMAISNALSRDINSFTKDQIYKLPDYKISVDWVLRIINRLMYIRKLLLFAMMGQKKISSYDVKTASGIAGPWAHLDLPMEERVFPFGSEIDDTSRDKRKQRRYKNGLKCYNNGNEAWEGYYWREMRNEPFSWNDRSFDDPYPTRKMMGV